MFSLEDLSNAGFFKLYPELSGLPPSKNDWTNRVRWLRSIWSKEHETTHAELAHAFNVAAHCFWKDNVLNMVLLQMAFKNRRSRSVKGMGRNLDIARVLYLFEISAKSS